jgi:hypothetical protein
LGRRWENVRRLAYWFAPLQCKQVLPGVLEQFCVRTRMPSTPFVNGVATM